MRDSCVRNPSEARRSLVNSATALDSYVGWIVASWTTFFTQTDERNTYIVCSESPYNARFYERYARVEACLTFAHVHCEPSLHNSN